MYVISDIDTVSTLWRFVGRKGADSQDGGKTNTCFNYSEMVILLSRKAIALLPAEVTGLDV